jgi:D-arabinose 1-dehydrogenase-like Zn-dependent alcohol dehydrogenase
VAPPSRANHGRFSLACGRGEVAESRLGKKAIAPGWAWHGGQDNTCSACRAGDFANGETTKITGITYDGGYQEYMVAPIEAVARIPDGLEPAEAAPLLCAGITTLNSLGHSGAGPGDLVAVQGIGGLGRLE